MENLSIRHPAMDLYSRCSVSYPPPPLLLPGTSFFLCLIHTRVIAGASPRSSSTASRTTTSVSPSGPAPGRSSYALIPATNCSLHITRFLCSILKAINQDLWRVGRGTPFLFHVLLREGRKDTYPTAMRTAFWDGDRRRGIVFFAASYECSIA